MSIAKLKQAVNIFGGTVDVMRGVGQNISDNVYCGLGYTQAVCMVMLTTAWLIVMFPELGLNPMNEVYSAMYNLTKKELNNANLSHGFINYLLWGLGTIVSIRVGERIGRMIWGLYCLCQTGCRSSRPMDFPLSSNERDRVVHYMLPAFAQNPELDVNMVGVKKVNQKRAQIIHWIHQVLLFYTDKYQNDKRKGKYQTAQLWWDEKKEFRKSMKAISLYQRVIQYYQLLERRKQFVVRKKNLLQAFFQQEASISKADVASVLNDILKYFQESVLVRHQRRYRQNIFQDVKKLRKLINQVTFEIQDTTSLKNKIKYVMQLLEKVYQRLSQQQAKVPLGPVWLQSMMNYSMPDFYQAHALRLTAQAADKVAIDLSHLSLAQRHQFWPNLSRTFNQGFNLSEQHADQNDERKVRAFDQISHRRTYSDDMVGRVKLLEMSKLSHV